jgi:hypothetical protein
MEETCYALSSNFWKLATDYFFFGVPIGIFFELLEDVGILDFDGLMLPVENPLLSKGLPLFLSTQLCTKPLLSRISTLCWESLKS